MSTRTALRPGYRCDDCGYAAAKWMGFCPQCKSRSGLVEAQGALGSFSGGRADLVPLADAHAPARARYPTGIDEFDRALGGGLVPGAVVVVGGEPGVGKSTLLLQVAAAASADGPVALVTAEESVDQVALRARRLQLDGPGLLISAETVTERIIAALEDCRPRLAIVDSIQTVTTDDVEGPAGATSQVRGSAALLVSAARRLGTTIVLVGHVTKDGMLAGPKLLEHMVDVVCALEGDHHAGLRFLRPLKNRYGSVDQAGIFEMTERGLLGVPDPAGLFVGEAAGTSPGTVLFPTVQGRRALLVEVQALVTATGSPQPRRSVKGVEAARVHQLLAVLARHGGVDLARHEVYVNVAGGLRVTEPAIDLPVAVALASSHAGIPTSRIAAWGEVGLGGEVRSVAHRGRRAGEAGRLGVATMLAPDEGAQSTLAEMLLRAGVSPTRAAAPGR